MAKHIIQINEEQLKELLRDAVNSVLKEIDHRTAPQPMVSNMNSNNELQRGNDIGTLANGRTQSYSDKRDCRSKMTYKVLTQGVFDNVGKSIVLRFGRSEEDFTISNVDFYFNELRLLTPKRFVIEGTCNMSRSPISDGKRKPKKIQIDYKFEEQQFYEAVYCANGTVRDIKPLNLDYAGVIGKTNIATAQQMIQFLTKCLYSIEDGQTDTINKTHANGKL